MLQITNEHNINLTEVDLQRKTNCYYALKPIDQVLIALQFYASGGLLQVVGDITGIDNSTVSLAVHNADAILKRITVLTHGKLHYGILIVDLRDNMSGFLHHVLTVNQRLTNLPSNRAFNNVLNSSD